MRLNQRLVQINRNFLICFVISASLSAAVAQSLDGQESYLNATFTIIFGYVVYFGIFSVLFYFENKRRYKKMESGLVRKEIIAIISSFGVGEVIYLAVRWPSLYYLLETGIEPYLASLISEAVSTALYMASVTVFLKGTRAL